MGLNNFNNSLGDLEAEIMDVVWETDNATVRNVFDSLRKKRKIAYTTVMTIMTRLCAKKFLKRKLNNDGAYVYKSVQSRQDFIASASKKAIHRLIKDFGEVAVAQLADIIESNDIKNLEDWNKKNKKTE